LIIVPANFLFSGECAKSDAAILPRLRRVSQIEMPNETSQDLCPRCGSERLRAWGELDGEQREVVRRLPASAHFKLEERAARHRWCVRCWHEETRDAGHDA
jgi:hypothetical protein